MIYSTTELLNEITSIHTTAGGPALLTKPNQLSEYSQKQRKEFALHFVCMQAWFTRCSWLEKLNTLTQLLQGLKTIDSLSLILNTLLSTFSKTTVYAEIQYSTNFVYDKTLKDHNRSLHQKTFKEMQKADIEWFNSLEEDHHQVLIIIGLIRLGGGSVTHHVFEQGKKLYYLRLQKLKEVKQHASLIEIKRVATDRASSECNVKISPYNEDETNLLKRHTRITPGILNIKPVNMDELEKHGPNDPFAVEVEKFRKAWYEKIKKYRIQVEGKPPSSRKKGKGKGNRKGGKGGKKGKNAKSTKSNKSGKSGKGKKRKKGKKTKAKGEELDYIQLLPIWIVKKIFNYLDAKTLKKVKAVNKYWTYAITDLQKDQKTRTFLDKFISKMEEALQPVQTQTDILEKSMVLRPTPTSLKPNKRLLQLWERGAVAPKVKIDVKSSLIKQSLAMNATMQAPGDYLLPVHLLECFPRKIPKGTSTLHKARSWIVNELGFIKITHDLPAPLDSVDRFPSEVPLEYKKQRHISNPKTSKDSSRTTRTSAGESRRPGDVK